MSFDPANSNLALISVSTRTSGKSGAPTFRAQHLHALQTNLVERLAKGLTFQIAYTYAKTSTMDPTPQPQRESKHRRVAWAFCESCNRGPSDFDLTHNFVLNFQ